MDQKLTRFDSSKPIAFSRNDLIRLNHRKITEVYHFTKSPIGSGAFGQVFTATHRLTRIERAVKVIPKKMVTDVEMLKAEIDIMIDLDHPNVIKLIEYFEDSKNVYLVMELCKGGELFQRIIDKGSFSEAEAAYATRQMLQALVYCHKQSIMHRDLKPENFLYRSPNSDDGLKLIDFGLSDRFQSGHFKSSRAGTVWYMSPEKLNGQYDEKADMWSIGVILFIMLCGYPPFSNDERKAIKQITKSQWEMEGEEWSRVSYQAKALVRRLMDDNPQTRISGEQALMHPWVVELAPLGEQAALGTISGVVMQKEFEKRGPLNVIASFKKFRKAERLKRAALGVMAQYLTEDNPQVRLLRDLFFKLDQDGDGIVDVADLKVYLSNEHPEDALDEETLSKLLKSVDMNRSGRIDYSEFLAAMIQQEVYGQDHLCRLAFQAFDPADTGYITSEGLRYVLGKTLGEQTLEEYKQMIFEVDANKDGKIDFAEFENLMKRNRKPGQSMILTTGGNVDENFYSVAQRVPPSLPNQPNLMRK
eukprot:GDKJ01055713.1.p1 GENE.GDKJ01055713.1~~GDKJ01055713.1.p1  ORF type:complete len:555 (-),score=139.23 GDKJ01055713.1:126-1718(-)